jgi:dihydrolipoamide dehydrogenase
MVVGEIAMGTDLLVIGAGPGGYVAAIRAAQLGQEVTLVEEAETLGGICLNHGCIPSKALIYAASLYHRIPALGDMGIKTGSVKLDVAQLQNWKESVVKKLTGGVAQLCKGNDIQVLQGKAVFTSPKKVLVESEHGTQAIEFKNCIVATGSRSIEIPSLAFDGQTVISSRQALKFTEAPEKLVIIGGGYIGLELGTVWAKLGSKVTVIEMMEQLLPGTDLELVRLVERNLKKLGVEIHLKSKAKQLKKGKDGAIVIVDSPEGELTLEAEKILVSVGRRPNTDGLEPPQGRIALNEKGFIKIDGQLRTSNPHIYAIGDVAGQPMLAHKASHEGIVAAEICAGHASGPDWQVVPAVIFTDPEIAYCGLNEQQAQAQGYKPLIGKFPFAALGRALTMGEPEGFVKIIADADSKQVLGVQIVGPEASNLISEAALAIELGARLDDLAMTIHPHPTLPEGLMEAAEAALGQVIHILLPKKKEPARA